MDKCTILVNSCDTYSDLWEAFFRILSDRWKGKGYPIVLNTESLKFSSDYCKVRVINTSKDLQWGGRLKKVLNLIDTPYVLFLLDVFFPINDSLHF